MATAKVERRVYAVSPHQLFGMCVTALGQLRATIKRHDVEQGMIVASFGAGSLGSSGELTLALRPAGEGHTELSATWRAQRGGDRRVLRVFLDAVAALIGPG